MRWILYLMMTVCMASPAWAFMADGCGAGSCTDCHSLTVDEARGLLGSGVERVLGVEFSEMPGLWVVEVENQGQKFPLYIDYSKSFVVSGSIIRLKDKADITGERFAKMNKVDVSKIPLENSILLGKRTASKKVFVFTDPQCPYCKKLHAELKKVVASDPDIAFLIKLFPLKMHPNAYGISQSVLCADSLELLEASFADKPIPPATCQSRAVDQTIEVAQTLGIRATPTMILPDGMRIDGAKKAEEILKLLGSSKPLKNVAK